MRISALPAFLPLLFALLPAIGTAANAEALASASSQQLAIYSIERNFHMQTLLSGDPTRAAMLKALVAARDKVNAQLGDPTGNAAADAALKRAQAAWPAFRKFALANDVATSGYTDGNLAADLHDAAGKLDQALAEAIAALKPAQLPAEIHAANLLLQRTTTAYLKRAAQMSPEIGAGDNFDIAAETQRLDGMLQALQKQLAGRSDLAVPLRDVMGKWIFIKPRLISYNERTVPYIVDRYAQPMSDDLSQLAAQAPGM